MTKIGTLQVVYNRHARCWQAQGAGEVKSFTAGHQGRHDAFAYAISITSPRLATAVSHFIEQHPSGRGRIVAAARLLVAGHVCA